MSRDQDADPGQRVTERDVVQWSPHCVAGGACLVGVAPSNLSAMLSEAVRPGSPALPGNKGAVRSHCFSLTSYRFTPIINLRSKAETYESRIKRFVNPECRLNLACQFDEEDPPLSAACGLPRPAICRKRNNRWRCSFCCSGTSVLAGFLFSPVFRKRPYE